MTTRTDHPTDEQLLGLADGEIAPGEAQALNVHVKACASCASRRDALVSGFDRLGEMLRASDWPAPAVPSVVSVMSRPMPAWWRAAAIIVAIVAGAVIVEPVRALIVRGARVTWQGLTGLLGGGSGEGGNGKGVVQEGPTASASFAPGPRLVVRLDEQTQGRLTVEVVEGEVATVHGAGDETRLFVGPGELRIAGVFAPNRWIAVRVPVSVGEVEVREAAAAARVFRPVAVGERWVLELARERR